MKLQGLRCDGEQRRITNACVCCLIARKLRQVLTYALVTSMISWTPSSISETSISRLICQRVKRNAWFAARVNKIATSNRSLKEKNIANFKAYRSTFFFALKSISLKITSINSYIRREFVADYRDTRVAIIRALRRILTRKWHYSTTNIIAISKMQRSNR